MTDENPNIASSLDNSAEAAAPSRRAEIPKTVVALGIVSLLNDLGGDAVTPLLPAFVATVGGSPEALGLIEGAADATTSLVQLASGYLADKTGKLKALTFAGYGCTGAALAISASFVLPASDATSKTIESLRRET